MTPITPRPPLGSGPAGGAGPGSEGQPRRRILLVDDEASVRRFIQRTLSRAGYEVVEAESGEDALGQALQMKAPLDLLLTDIMMPIMTGTQLSSRLRGLQPDLPVLYITGFGAHTIDPLELEQRARVAAKPLSPSELLDHVRTMLGSEP